MIPFSEAVNASMKLDRKVPNYWYKRWIQDGIEYSLELEPILTTQGYMLALYHKKPSWQYPELLLMEKIPVWPMEVGDIYLSTAPHHMIFDNLDSTEEES